MNKKRSFEIGQQYHLYARGTDKRETFILEQDFIRFMALLYLCNTKELVRLTRTTLKDIEYMKEIKLDPLVKLDQFCLMPNHFHILCTQLVEGGISKFMQKVLTGYTRYFNKKYNREGALFSATYKSRHIDNDFYALYIKKYIYLNPLKLIKSDYNSKEVLLYENEKLTIYESEFLKNYIYRST